MKIQTRKLLKNDFLVFAIALAIGFTHHQCSKSVAPEQKEKVTNAIPVKIAQEQVMELVQSVNVSGMVVASKQHRLSFKTGGIIDRILVKEGEAVKKGQLLATLKMDEIEAQVQQANLGLQKAQRDFDRVQNLFADSVATLEQLQNVTTALDLARSNVNIANYNRLYSKIEAPVNGRVLMKLNESNELVGPGTPVLVLASNEENWQLQTGVTDKEVVRLTTGNTAQVKLDAYPENLLEAVVVQIGDAPDPTNGLYEVKLSLINSNLEMKPGFYANADIFPEGAKSYLTISIDAVTEGVGNTVSYYALSPDSTKAIKKTAGVEWIQGDLVVLAGNIEKTDAIIIESQKELNHLALVEVIE